MKQFLYIDGTDDVIELHKRSYKIKMGDQVTIDGTIYEAWYIEEVSGSHRNIRVEAKIA